jgi:hypothetical protein
MKHRVCFTVAVAVLALSFGASAQQTGTHIKKIDKVVVTTLATEKDSAKRVSDKDLRAMPALPVIVEEAVDETATSTDSNSTQAE